MSIKKLLCIFLFMMIIGCSNNAPLNKGNFDDIDKIEYALAEKYYTKIEYINFMKTMFEKDEREQAFVFSKGFHIGEGRSNSSEIQKLKAETYEYRSDILTEDVAIRIERVLLKIDTFIENTDLFLQEKNDKIFAERKLVIAGKMEELYLLLYPCCQNVTNSDLAFYNLLAYPNQTIEKNGPEAVMKLLQDIGEKIEEIEGHYELN